MGGSPDSQEANRAIAKIHVEPRTRSYWVLRRNRALKVRAQLHHISKGEEPATCWFCNEAKMNWEHFEGSTAEGKFNCSDLNSLLQTADGLLGAPTTPQLWKQLTTDCTQAAAQEARATLAQVRWENREAYDRRAVIMKWKHQLARNIKWEVANKGWKVTDQKWTKIAKISRNRNVTFKHIKS